MNLFERNVKTAEVSQFLVHLLFKSKANYHLAMILFSKLRK